MTKPTRNAARSISLIAAVLLLPGCDKDFATLTFEDSLRSSPDRSGAHDGKSLPSHHEQLKELMRAQGIDPAMITTRVKGDQGQRLVLSESIFGGLATEQKASLQTAFKTIIATRQAPMIMHLVIHPEAMPNAGEYASERAQGLPQEYEGQFWLGEVSLSVAFGMGHVVDGVLKGSLQMQSEAFWNVTALLDTSLPFLGLTVLEDDRSTYHHALRKNLSSRYSNDMIPVEISFRDPDLQSLISQGKVDLSSNMSDQDRRASNKQALT